MRIFNGLIYSDDFQFHPGRLSISEDLIDSVEPGDRRYRQQLEPDDFDAAGCYIIPGLIDIHTHGCAGRGFCDGKPGALDEIGRFLARQGITTYLAASMSLPESELAAAFSEACGYAARQTPEQARLAGIYMEGPFLASAKKGAHPESCLTNIDPGLVDRLDRVSGQLVRVVCLAPELPGSLGFIRSIRKRFVISLGHTQADYALATAAFKAGASLVTHLFNGMNPFSHREPGVPGAAYDRGAMVELICDGIHLHSSMVRASFQLYGAERVILVSDSMAACGMPDGDYQLGGRTVQVREGVARLPDGTLAGSSASLLDNLRRAVDFGIPLASAVRTVTANPARLIGFERKLGSLAAGKQADILLLDKQLNVVRVLVRGKWLDLSHFPERRP